MPRIGILIVAYNAASTLAQVLDRIPRSLVPKIGRVLVTDDASTDSTYLIGVGYEHLGDLPLTVIRQPSNLGYGGNQKAAYHWAMEHDLDIVVLLHGDGQYAPEVLPEIVAPLERGECDAVMGSRMLERGAARRGGMPLYKLVGNKILTRFENAVVGMELSEWHSGYRAYSLDALRQIPFERNSDGFDFDTEIIIQLHEAGKRIAEVPIPTYYGDEISRVNGLAYARNVCLAALRYRLHKVGLGSGELAFSSSAYELKDDPASSHGRLLTMLSRREPSRVLDLGCSDGAFAEMMRRQGHLVTGVDHQEHAGVADRVDRFVRADLEQGIPDQAGAEYDVIVAADVLEHVRDPRALLEAAAERLAPGGSVLVSVPNFGHWYPRARVAAGRFDYDRRGILDRDHLRFFTRRSFERLARDSGFTVRRREAVGTPFEVTHRGRAGRRRGNRTGRLAHGIDRAGLAVAPTVFAYQFLCELEPVRRLAPAAPTPADPSLERSSG